MGSFRGLRVIFILGLHFWVSFQSSGPVDGLIRHILKVSFKQCVKECQQMSKCLTATYTRLSGLCRLFEKPYNLPPEFGDTAYTKSVNGNNTTQTTDKQYEADSTCTANSCGEPPKLPATEISGNMVSVGAKVRYRCLDGSKSAISVCLSNGSWSLKSLNCNCSFPPSFDNDTSLNVESWAYRFDNHTHFTAVAHCLSNCSAETKTQATCEIAIGEWILPSTICCTSIAKGKYSELQITKQSVVLC